MAAFFAEFLQACLDFSNILNASITASWVILAVLALRLLLRKAPKWIHAALWGLVALRILLPFPIESIFSLIPSTETLPSEILTYGPVYNSQPARLDIVTNPIFSEPVSVTLPQTIDRVQGITMNWSFLWLAGIAVMLCYTLISYWQLRRRVLDAVRLRCNIYQSERIASPFVLGIFRPRIYLPYGINQQDMVYVIAHEKAHIRRKDHWWKPLGFLLLTIHWFNPLMWLAYILLCRDIELACDEKVIKTLEREDRANYSVALLQCSVSHRSIAACPLAFGEVGVKNRVKNVLNYRKPRFWIILTAVIACTIAAVCFLTDPINSQIVNPWTQEYIPGTGNILGSVDTAYFESVSSDFTIGADRYGRAVFKEPRKAFDTFRELYAESIRLIREQEDLPPLSQANTGVYKKFGWQLLNGTEEQKEQARFVTKFLDIYENSFDKSIPVSDEGMEPTKELLSLEKTVELAQKGKKLDWKDFESFASEEVGSGLYILRYEIDDVFHVMVGGVPDETPWYIRLCSNSTQEYIDLTTDDPLPFIQHYSSDYSATDLNALWDKDKYTVTSQEDAEITLNVRSSALTDACYTEEGQDFEPGQVIAYQDSNTRIWLSRVQQSNESENQLYFFFQCDYAIGNNGSALSVNRRSTDGSYTNAVTVSSHVIKTGWDAYPDAVSLRGEGPGQQFTLYVSSDACRAIENRMAFQVKLNKVSYQRKITAQEIVSDPLEEAVSAAILDHYETDKEDGLLHVESHIVLDVKEKENSPFLFWQEKRVTEVTVFLLALHESYRTDTGELEHYGASCCPTAITFRVAPEGAYTLEEYWEPRAGTHYSSDVKNKFSGEAAKLLWEYDGAYSSQLDEENLQKARDYVVQYGTTYTTVEYLLKQILPYDTTAKNPQLWLDESPEEYQRLLDFGTGTLYYCFNQFLEGGQTDMRGHIMALLCQQIMAQWNESYDVKGGGQDWFDGFRRKAETMLTEQDHEILQKHCPGVWMLMEMTAAIIPAPATFTRQVTDILISSAVTLREDGTFWFSFSPISSYLGHGDYTIQDNRLILPTDDGRFTYYFDILDENTLAFDANASSDMTWFSKLEDGDVFIKGMPGIVEESSVSLKDLPDTYNAEQAEIDGCLIISDNSVLSGQEIWKGFLSDVNRGQPAFLRVFRSYQGRQGSQYEKEIYDLHFDGSIYALTVKVGSEIYTYQFSNLRYFYGQVSNESVDYDAIERYVLTNDPDASWEEIWRSAASSRYGDLIDHFVVYSQVFDLPDYLSIPELSSAALEMDGQTLAYVDDPDAVNRLLAILSKAENIGYEPKTYYLGVTLVLTAADGSVHRYDLDLYGDMIVADGKFYDYGPGYTDVGAYNGQGDLFAIFGRNHWPDAVYEKYDWIGPIPNGVQETEPADALPGGSLLVWHPDWTCQEITQGNSISAILKELGSAELTPTTNPQPNVEDSEYTLHIAYDTGDEFDLVYMGNNQFFYRVFKTQQGYTFQSAELREIMEFALNN